jgi:hypothetical protein
MIDDNTPDNQTPRRDPPAAMKLAALLACALDEAMRLGCVHGDGCACGVCDLGFDFRWSLQSMYGAIRSVIVGGELALCGPCEAINEVLREHLGSSRDPGDTDQGEEDDDQNAEPDVGEMVKDDFAPLPDFRCSGPMLRL